MGKAKRIIDYDELLKDSLIDVRGPTRERLERAGEHFSIGGQDRGVRVIHALDTPLDCLYANLVRSAKTEDSLERLRVEYAALMKYYRLFVESGMVGSIGSVDPNRTYSPNPSGRTFLAGSERQQNIRDEYRMAVIHLNNSEEWGHKQTIVVDNVVCHERDPQIAGYCIGEHSVEVVESILRDAGYRLAKMWGMVR